MPPAAQPTHRRRPGQPFPGFWGLGALMTSLLAVLVLSACSGEPVGEPSGMPAGVSSGGATSTAPATQANRPAPAPPRAPDPARQTVLVLGDSLSAGYGLAAGEGWVDLLDARLATDHTAWQAVNASVSGDTTGGGVTRLPAALERWQPEVVVIELGGNDGLRGYPVERIAANLGTLIDMARDAGARILLVGMHIPPSYGPRYTDAFHAVYRELAKAPDVALVPFLLEQVALDATLMQADGIHPTAAAQPVLLDTVWPHLVPLLDDPAAD